MVSSTLAGVSAALQACAHVPHRLPIYVDIEDLKSGPHACAASALIHGTISLALRVFSKYTLLLRLRGYMKLHICLVCAVGSWGMKIHLVMNSTETIHENMRM